MKPKKFYTPNLAVTHSLEQIEGFVVKVQDDPYAIPRILRVLRGSIKEFKRIEKKYNNKNK